MSDKSITWSVPFIAHRQVAIAEIKKIYPVMAFIRMTLLFTAIFIFVWWTLPRRIPNLDVNWVKLFFVCIGAMFALIATSCLVAFAPPQITVNERGIVVQQGNHCVLHLFKDMASIQVDERTSPLRVLRINFLTQKKEEIYPIAPTVSTEHLLMLIDRFRYSN